MEYHQSPMNMCEQNVVKWVWNPKEILSDISQQHIKTLLQNELEMWPVKKNSMHAIDPASHIENFHEKNYKKCDFCSEHLHKGYLKKHYQRVYNLHACNNSVGR